MKIYKTQLPELQKKVIISSNDNLDYYFFMPIVACLWRQMGYHPVFAVIASSNKWLNNSINRYVIGQTLMSGGDIYLIQQQVMRRDRRFNGYQTSAIAQVCRICPNAILPNLDTYVLTSDSDMLPLSKQFFSQCNDNKKIHIYYSNAYGQDQTRFPICYIGMKNKIWSQINGTSEIENTYSILAKVLNNGLKNNSPKHVQWNYDQIHISNNIIKSKYYLNDCWKLKRDNITNPSFMPHMVGVPGWIAQNRLDRSNWKYISSSIFVQAHCMRKSFQILNWRMIEKVLQERFDRYIMKRISNYRNGFVKYV